MNVVLGKECLPLIFGVKTDAIMKLGKEITRKWFICLGEILIWDRGYKAKINNSVLFARWTHFNDDTIKVFQTDFHLWKWYRRLSSTEDEIGDQDKTEGNSQERFCWAESDLISKGQ